MNLSDEQRQAVRDAVTNEIAKLRADLAADGGGESLDFRVARAGREAAEAAVVAAEGMSTTTNEALIAEARRRGGDSPRADVVRLADALEAVERERELLARGFKAAYDDLPHSFHVLMREYPDDLDNVAVREALALIEKEG